VKVKVKDAQARGRYATRSEWEALKAAVQAAPQPWCDYFAIAMLTGARRSNVASMRFEHLDLKAGIWRIPADEFKGQRDNEVVLLPEAVEILRKRQGGGFVFPAKSKLGHVVEPFYAWRTIQKAARVNGLTVHDIRRSVGVRMVEAGCSLPVIARVLGHNNLATTQKVYALATPEAARTALEAALT
jgi:integrase